MKTGTRKPEGARRGVTARGRRGTSLVEVLVVLVILLIGVFSVIRVFPVGFTALRQAESRTLATRLASQLLEQLKADDANLPQNVLFQVYNNGGNPPVKFWLSEDPDDLTPFPGTNPNGIYSGDNYTSDVSDVNRFRYILGEPVKVPLPTNTGQYGGGSLYALKFGPAFMEAQVGDPDAVVTSANVVRFNYYLRVYGAKLRGIPAEQESGFNARRFLRGPQTYLIDYGGDGSPAAIVFQPRRPRNRAVPVRTFRITYSYINNGVVVTVPPTDIVVPDNDDLVWQPIPDLAGRPVSDIYEGSDTVSRNFTRLPVTTNGGVTPWDEDDPYEYKLLSKNVTGTSANVGVLAFNPSGANYSEQTAFGNQAFTAHIDYSVLDWHILREDREVPTVLFNSSGAVPLKLTLPYIKRTGDADADQNVYNGLYNDGGADIQVFDLQGTVARTPGINDSLGEPLLAGDYAVREPNADYWIDLEDRDGSYRTGTIFINPARVPPGSQLRILYKAEGDWAVALQKANAAYEQAYTYDTSGSTYTALPRPTSFDNFGRDGTRLYFFLSDLNKSVVATLEYTDTAGEVQRTAPTQITVDQTEPNVGSGGEKYAYVDVTPYMPDLAGPNAWRVVGNANGVSVKVRVVWKDNVSTTNAWRIQDLDTYITQAVGL